MTDVTGFGLLGHLLEMCRGSSLAAEISLAALPVLPTALKLAEEGYATGAAERNWNSYGESVELVAGIGEWQRKLLCDPQTSGGLLVACAPEGAEAVLSLFRAHGFQHAQRVGWMKSGPPIAQVGL
jgi:selenide,water dikinase